MKNLTRSVLFATLFFASMTILMAALLLYSLPSFNFEIVDRAIAAANDPSITAENLHGIVEQLGRMARGFAQAAKGAFIVAVCVGILSTLSLSAVYGKLKSEGKKGTGHD